MHEEPSEISSHAWFKSSYSGANTTECVEVAALDAGMSGVRDSKDPAGSVLVFRPAAWAAFIAAVQRGEFG
jgi:hypothetical protein